MLTLSPRSLSQADVVFDDGHVERYVPAMSVKVYAVPVKQTFTAM